MNIYAFYYDWEFELICTRQKHDVELWKRLAIQYGDPILEICCGSGRITKELSALGLSVTALDNSPEMLQLLENKHLPNVRTILADMTTFDLQERFQFIFISYSSFQQLLTLEEQLHCLQTIRKHLAKDGVLALDLNPGVCEGTDFQDKEIVYIADYPEHNSRITMFSSYRIDLIKQIKFWEDTYVEIDADGKRTEFGNKVALKECSPDYMKMLFEKCGFHVIKVFGDFRGGEVSENSENIIYLVK